MIRHEVQTAAAKREANPRKYDELAFKALCKLANAGNPEALKELQTLVAK